MTPTIMKSIAIVLREHHAISRRSFGLGSRWRVRA
jgi:hypothetical protein